MFPGPRSCRSASFRLTSLKNHLQQSQGKPAMLEGRAGGRTGGRNRDSGSGEGWDSMGPGSGTQGWTHSSVSSELSWAT